MQNDSKQDKRIYTLSEEKPAKAVIALGVPLIMGMFIMVLYNLVDTYFISLMGDDYKLAAVNLAYPIMMISVAVSNMIGAGASSLIARCLGAGQKGRAEQTLTAGFVLTVIDSAVIAVTGLAFLPQVVKLLGAKESTFAYTEDYVMILLIGSLFTMGSYTISALLRSEGSVRLSIVGMIAGTIANIGLDPLFIFTFGLGVKGAAAATVIGNGVSLGISLYFYLSGKTMLKPRARFIRLQKETAGEIFRVGIPATLETLLTSTAYIINNNLAVAYGELTVTAVGIAQKIMTLGNYIYQGFASGTQPIMGYNYGAKNYKRMLSVLRSGVMVVSMTELAVMIAYGTLAPLLIGIFSKTPEVVETGAKALRAIMCILPFVGATSMSRMSFQAMGKPKHAFTITLIRQLILYIPLQLLLNHIFGFSGMIWAQPMTEVIMMCVSLLLLYKVIRREAANGADSQ